MTQKIETLLCAGAETLANQLTHYCQHTPYSTRDSILVFAQQNAYPKIPFPSFHHNGTLEKITRTGKLNLKDLEDTPFQMNRQEDF